MEVSCVTEEGAQVCKLEMSDTPALDISFEHEKKFYKVRQVKTVVPKNEEDEKTFICIVKELTQEQHEL